MDKKEYAKAYQHCMYLARKELVINHQQEFNKIMDRVMLDSGIITRRTQRQNNHRFLELLKDSTDVEVTQ